MTLIPAPGALPVLAAVVYYATYPIFFLYRLATLILGPFFSLLQFILLPITYTLHGLFHVLAFPFRLRLLERLETLWIYLGIAALIGCAAGAVLHVVFTTMAGALRIDARSERERRREWRREEREDRRRLEAVQGRTVEEFRARRRLGLEIDGRRRSALDYPEFATRAMARGATPGVKRESGVREGELKAYPLFEEEDSW